jgi:hypothetical protein
LDLLSSSALSERFAGSTGLIAGKPTHKVPRKSEEKGTDLFEEKGTDLFNEQGKGDRFI